MNLKGGPSYQLMLRSSEPVAMRNGRVGLKAHVMMRFEWLSIAPTVLPESQVNTLPKDSRPSPTAQRRCPSPDHAMSSTFPPSAKVSSLSKCSGWFAQMRTVPRSSPDAIHSPFGETATAVTYRAHGRTDNRVSLLTHYTLPGCPHLQ